MNDIKNKVVVTLHCKSCDDKQNILVDKIDTLPIAKARGFLVANTLIYT